MNKIYAKLSASVRYLKNKLQIIAPCFTKLQCSMKHVKVPWGSPRAAFILAWHLLLVADTKRRGKGRRWDLSAKQK